METNKFTYIHNNLVNSNTQVSSGDEDILWKRNTATSSASTDKGYKTICSDVAIGKDSEPQATLDISGSVNVSATYTINHVSIAPPVGSVMAYVVPNTPDGWLICDGREICRKRYAALFDVISTTFGEGNGTSTFHLPNYQGAFLRGTGSNGLYSGPPVNTPQAHATQTHTHTATTTINDPGHNHSQSHTHNATVYDPGHTHVLSTYTETSDGNHGPSFGKNGSTSTVNTIMNGANTGISVGVSVDNTNVNTSSTGITATTNVGFSSMNSDVNETRPYNYGVYWIIKV